MKLMRVLIIGLGNIGSQLVGLVAQMLAARGDNSELVLVDPDSYEVKNLEAQAIDRDDIGLNKAEAKARPLRLRHPALRITAHPCRLEDLPLGEFFATAVISGLDSMVARLALNQRVLRMGTLWIDAGVAADDRLARVTVFQPGSANACMACGMSEAEWAAQSVRHLCADAAAPATNAPAALGALAASLSALEFEKMLANDHEHLAVGKEIALSAKWHTHLVTTLPRDAACRADHEAWRVEPMVGADPLRISLSALWSPFASDQTTLSVPGFPWSAVEQCGACGTQVSRLRLSGRESEPCACGGQMKPLGFHLREELTRDEFAPEQFTAPLSTFGIRPRDILTFRDPLGTSHHLLLLP